MLFPPLLFPLTSQLFVANGCPSWFVQRFFPVKREFIFHTVNGGIILYLYPVFVSYILQTNKKRAIINLRKDTLVQHKLL